MPFVIDDITVAATELAASEEISTASTEGAELLGDGIGESTHDISEVKEESNLDSSDQPEIVGDGIGESHYEESSAPVNDNEPSESPILHNGPSIQDEPESVNQDCPIEGNIGLDEVPNDVEQPEMKKTGGSYGELKAEGWGWDSEPPKEKHHMPADSISHLETNDGPAIVMDYEDHKQTASCGSSREAKEYRAFQKNLIDQGKFREALQMDIDDLHEKFGDKYDKEIKQMLDYVDELEKNGKI